MLGTEAAGEEEPKQEVEGLTQEPQAVQGGEDGHWTAPFQVPGRPTQRHIALAGRGEGGSAFLHQFLQLQQRPH